MTTDEKLKHFLDFCIEDARTRSGKMLDEYMTALETTFEEHKVDANRRAEMRIQLESEKIERDINKQLSIEQINIKRTLGHKQDELKDMLFVELKDMLANFMETSQYLKLLDAQIKKAIEFAGNDELVVYLDPADESKVNQLSLLHSVEIKISQYSFSGGTRAVIPSRHILIDNSFETKLEEAKQQFHFDLTLNAGGKIDG